MKLFHHQQFHDVAALCEKKRAAQQTISVVIPTLDEEDTIAAIVAGVRDELMLAHAYVDEILVIDSGSTDRTVERARAAGATVYLAAEIRPELGDRPGKGENLWKSQFVSRGTITCFIDGDILDYHGGFVTGLTGPLLEDESIEYVKAFYRRPLVQGDQTAASGGGRVSEILIRPLFSLFYPQLSAMVQPLAGEYAVRRSLLRQLPFPSGYAVETAHLIDVRKLRGIGVFAQCDLECRQHRNRDLIQLGEMSGSILRVFLQRAERDGLLQLSSPLGEQMIQQIGVAGGWELRKKNLDLSERPPYDSLPLLADSL